MAAEPAPSPTIYINNLNEKTAVDTVKEEIEAMFGQFGVVRQVTAMKGRLPNGHYRKGQAWVLFDSIEAASAAKDKMQGFVYHDKEMRIEFSKNKSDALAKEDGTYQPRAKRTYVPPLPGAEEPGEEADEGDQMDEAERLAPPPPGAGGATAMDTGTAEVTRPASEPSAPKKRKVSKNAGNLPYKILFLEHLPPSTDKNSLVALFNQHAGYKEVRVVPARCVAFVEFADPMTAGAARGQLDGYELAPEYPMTVNFSKQ